MQNFFLGKIIVTCGPACAPVDAVRCITNFSTGELGTLLCDYLAEEGWEVFCLRGTGATYPCPLYAHILPFSTNADLEQSLDQLSTLSSIVGVFHAAALCDFRVARIANHHGVKMTAKKIGSHSGNVQLTLEPMPKIIGRLRHFFPQSYIVGWKYELEGLLDEVLSKGYQQIEEAATDACIVNGAALGSYFAFLEKGATLLLVPTKAQLCVHLGRWLFFHSQNRNTE